ncbi:MAG: hypothetical protein ABWZ25_16695 [Chitinophagaceae bacterium]
MSKRHIIIFYLILCTTAGYSQDSTPKATLPRLPSRFLDLNPSLTGQLKQNNDKGTAKKKFGRISISDTSKAVTDSIGLQTGLTTRTTQPDSLSPLTWILEVNPRIIIRNDTAWVYSGICKTLKTGMYIVSDDIQQPAVRNLKKNEPILRINGNIRYDFVYRSFLDTPYRQNDYQQHILQSTMSVVVKDQYPLKINVSTRHDNSPYFRNVFNAGLQYDQFAYIRSAKQKLLDRISRQQFQTPELKRLETDLQKEVEKFNSVKLVLNDPDILQKIIEEKEVKYYKLINATTNQPLSPQALDIDFKKLNQRLTYKRKKSLPESGGISHLPDTNFNNYIDSKKKELDSLQENIEKLQATADSIKNELNKDLVAVKQKVYKATSLRDLHKVARENGLSGEKENWFESFLSNVRSIGLGRSMVSYSELTAWNVSLTGFNLEYNSGVYGAVAAGKIDYGFRDFLGRNTRQRNQHLLLGRVGVGNTDNKAIIFSAFTGKKYNYGSLLADTISNHVNVIGYSVEVIIKRNENTSLNAEIAKTTKPLSGTFQNNHARNALVNFSDNSNLGISIKGQTIIKETDTRLNGFYKRTGEHFQSFSLFSYNTDQAAWLLKMDQSFIEDKVGVIAMLRCNDFTNPFTEKTFRTSTVFKSFQINVRFPRWPVISAGYYPGTQLYVIDKERVRENAYYISNASLIYHYTAGRTRMLSSLIYNSYSGKGTDSGFISYKGISYMAGQTFMFGKAQLQGLYTYTDQEQMQFSTFEANADYSVSSRVRIGVGLKYNKVVGGKSYWGSRAQILAEFGKLGGLQFQYEKSYLPTIYRALFAVETGSVSWFKYF